MKDLLNIDLGHTNLINGTLVCSKCKAKLNSLKKKRSLENHLITIIGFAEWHTKHCKQKIDKK